MKDMFSVLQIYTVPMVDSEVVNTLDKNGYENDDISSESDSEEMMLDMDVQVNSCILTSVRTVTVREDSSLDTSNVQFTRLDLALHQFHESTFAACVRTV